MNKLNINSKVVFNNKVEMPAIGFGVWKVAPGEEVESSVTMALKAGYRMIDTAMIYKNEEGVGKAIKASGIPREEIFVTTKLWNTDHGYENALKAIDVSLAKLGLSYVDLYLIHWPTAADVSNGGEIVSINKREETWKAMEEIYKSGKARAIGVSNYTIRHLEEMKKYAKVIPAVDQVEFHPFLYQKELLNYCNKDGIILEAYCPLTNGKKIDDERIGKVAKKYGKTNAQIILRWHLQHGTVPLPRSIQKAHIEENINIFDFELSAEDIKAIDAVNEDLHLRVDPEKIQ